MEKSYLTIQCAGLIAYCNAIIARDCGDTLQACFASLIGSPSHVKALSAVIFSGDPCTITGIGIDTKLTFFSQVQTLRSRKIGEVVNKIFISSLFGKNNNYAAVFGTDLQIVQERAFRSVDAATTIPLKPQWQEWLWENELFPEKLYSLGGEDYQEAYIITVPSDEKLEASIMAAIRNKELQ